VNFRNVTNYGQVDDAFRNKFKDQICTVVANGPSLFHVSNRFLEEFASFGCNRIYKRDGFIPTYFVQFGLNQVREEKALDFVPICKRVEAAFVNRLALERGWFPPLPNVFPILSRPLSDPYAEGIHDLFSFDPLDAIGVGGSVLYQSFQLAYWMGFTTVLVVGLDHYYPTDWNIPFHFYENDKSVTDKEPLGGRANWLERTNTAFLNARNAFEADNRKIINLTEGSRCDVFERDDLKRWTWD